MKHRHFTAMLKTLSPSLPTQYSGDRGLLWEFNTRYGLFLNTDWVGDVYVTYLYELSSGGAWLTAGDSLGDFNTLHTHVSRDLEDHRKLLMALIDDTTHNWKEQTNAVL